MYAADLTDQLTTDSILDAAYPWACKACVHTNYNNSAASLVINV